jgi:chaperonin GroES
MGGRKMKFKPLGARALVKEVEREQTTELGIVLPDTAKEKPQNAEVVAVSVHEDVKMSIGDVVVLRKYVGTEVKLDGEEHRIVDAEDILRVVEG